MSISTIHAELVDLIEAITPVYDEDYTFHCAEDEDGYRIPLESYVNNPTRVFDLRIHAPAVDDKLAGYPRTRFRVEFTLRIRYPADGDYTRTQMMLLEDIPLINNQLILPSNFPSGVDTIIPPEGTTLTEVTSDSGALEYVLLEIPVVVIYRT